MPAPKVMLLDEGTLGAFWRSGNNYASIDFDVDGIYPWAAAKDTDVVSGNWHDETLPQALRDIIST